MWFERRRGCVLRRILATDPQCRDISCMASPLQLSSWAFYFNALPAGLVVLSCHRYLGGLCKRPAVINCRRIKLYLGLCFRGFQLWAVDSLLWACVELIYSELWMGEGKVVEGRKGTRLIPSDIAPHSRHLFPKLPPTPSLTRDWGPGCHCSSF